MARIIAEFFDLLCDCGEVVRLENGEKEKRCLGCSQVVYLMEAFHE